MIALNRQMPQNCFECPCLQTYAIDSDENPYIQYLLRQCAARGQTMVTIKWSIGTHAPDEWTNWSKPEWCPWIELEDNNVN